MKIEFVAKKGSGHRFMAENMSRNAVIPRLDMAQNFDGLLGRRLVAYCIDLLVIFAFTCFAGLAVLLFGLITFGLGWILFALLIPGTALLYSALTVGGPLQATFGMRAAGLRVISSQGGRPNWLNAAVHALLFYVAAGTFLLWLLDVLIAFARDDRRLGHDLLAGLTVLRYDVPQIVEPM